MRRALIVGINHYPTDPLTASVEDAKAIKALLQRHEDGRPNFDCRLYLSEEKGPAITQPFLRKQLRRLFANEADVVLFYFSGHGVQINTSTHLATQDYDEGNEGISVTEL
ncbi:MAG: caspase family protein, partial [Bacteroidota bacterium]